MNAVMEELARTIKLFDEDLGFWRIDDKPGFGNEIFLQFNNSDENEAYHLVDFNFMNALSLVFKTKTININRQDFSQGCETCDNGSSEEIVYHIGDLSDEIMAQIEPGNIVFP